MPRLRFRLLLDYYLGGLLLALLKPPVILLGYILRRNHDLSRCHTVTYLKLLGGGSLVIAYPSFLAVKHAGKKLRLVATSSTAAFGRSLGVFDEIITIRDSNILCLGIDSLVVILKLFRAHAIVDLEIHSRLSTVFAALTMARNRIGAYTENSFWRRGISTHLLYYNKQSPVYGFYDQVAQCLGATIPAFEACVEMFSAHIARAALDGEHVEKGSVALAPACSELGRERMLRPEQWRVVLQDVMRSTPAARVHMLGGKNDRPYLEQLAKIVQPDFPQVEFVVHAGQLSLDQSIAFLRRAERLVAIDSALLHYARLLGRPAISYWGPTDPATRLRPRALPLDVIHYHRIACSPCIHIANEAPCHGHNICMQFAVDSHCGLNENPIWLAQRPIAGGGSHD